MPRAVQPSGQAWPGDSWQNSLLGSARGLWRFAALSSLPIAAARFQKWPCSASRSAPSHVAAAPTAVQSTSSGIGAGVRHGGIFFPSTGIHQHAIALLHQQPLAVRHPQSGGVGCGLLASKCQDFRPSDFSVTNDLYTDKSDLFKRSQMIVCNY